MTDRLNQVLDARRRVHSVCQIPGAADNTVSAYARALWESRDEIRAARDEIQALAKACIDDNDSGALQVLIAPTMAVKSLLIATESADLDVCLANVNQCARWLEQDVREHGGIDV